MSRRPRSTQLETCGFLLAGIVLLAAGACRKAPEPAAAPPVAAAPGSTASAGGSEASAPAPPEPAEAAPPVEPGPESLGASGSEIRFGLGLAPDGSVLQPVLTFGRGDRVCFSVSMPADTPPGRMTASWYDVEGQRLGEVSGSLAGTPPRVGLCLPGDPRLPLGPYQLELELDGRAAGEASFTVADVRESAARGSGA